MHMPLKDKNAQTHDPKPLCVFRRALKASHLILSVSLYLEEMVLSNDLKNNDYTYIHISFNHTLNHTTFQSTFLTFKILSYLFKVDMQNN